MFTFVLPALERCRERRPKRAGQAKQLTLNRNPLDSLLESNESESPKGQKLNDKDPTFLNKQRPFVTFSDVLQLKVSFNLFPQRLLQRAQEQKAKM
jgi:hypothetical protein